MYRAILMQLSPDASPLVVRVGLPMFVLDREIADLQQRLFLALGIAFLVALTLSVWLAHSITKPLSDIALAARRFSSDKQIFHVRTTAQDEVGLLASTLNHMADQLRAKIDELSEDRAQLLAVLTSMVEGVMVLDSRGYVLQSSRVGTHVRHLTRRARATLRRTFSSSTAQRPGDGHSTIAHPSSG